MLLNKNIQRAAHRNGIKGVMALASHCDMSYGRMTRIWHGEPGIRIEDVVSVLDILGHSLYVKKWVRPCYYGDIAPEELGIRDIDADNLVTLDVSKSNQLGHLIQKIAEENGVTGVMALREYCDISYHVARCVWEGHGCTSYGKFHDVLWRLGYRFGCVKLASKK